MESASRELQHDIPFQFSNEEFKLFLKKKGIQKETFEELKKLMQIINSWNYLTKEEVLMGHFHNFFNFAKENSIASLQAKKDEKFNLKPENWNAFLDIIISLVEKYGYQKVDALLDLLTRIKK